jgi:dihydrofolate reductase
MIVTLYAAADENNVIGRGNALPWKLRGDFKRMQAQTTGHTLIMGRKTHESIGRALPNRRNIVVTRDTGRFFVGCEIAGSLEQAIEMAREKGETEAFIFGGEQIYRLAMPIADRIRLTRVHAAVEGGDAFFPEIPAGEWRLTESERHEQDPDNEHAFTFETYERVS